MVVNATYISNRTLYMTERGEKLAEILRTKVYTFTLDFRDIFSNYFSYNHSKVLLYSSHANFFNILIGLLHLFCRLA